MGEIKAPSKEMKNFMIELSDLLNKHGIALRAEEKCPGRSNIEFERDGSTSNEYDYYDMGSSYVDGSDLQRITSRNGAIY